MHRLTAALMFALLLAAACAARAMLPTQEKVSPSQALQPNRLPAADFSTCQPPSYPREALAANHQGVTTLAVLVGSDGTVRQTELLGSSGSAALDTAASEAFSSCRYRPATLDGQAVERWTMMQYIWSTFSNHEAPSASLIRLLSKAAASGRADAQYALYSVLSTGNAQHAPRKSVALEALLVRSATGGYCPAKFQLGALYDGGTAAIPDREKAREWYRQAADCGHPMALQKLEDMAEAP
jgi:TonB family protein